MYSERMNESGERGFLGKAINKVQTWIRPEVKPYTQARPMTAEESALAQESPILRRKAEIRVESERRQAQRRKQTKVANIATAVGTTAIMAGIGVAAQTPEFGNAVNNIKQGMEDTKERVRKDSEPGTVRSDQSKKNIDRFDQSKLPHNTSSPPIPTLEPPKQT